VVVVADGGRGCELVGEVDVCVGVGGGAGRDSEETPRSRSPIFGRSFICSPPHTPGMSP